MPPSLAPRHHGIFSARTGNIYTTSLLHQWVQWALQPSLVPDEVWSAEGRYFDPFRPQVEPGGFGSVEELTRSRLQAIASFRQSIVNARYFVFTLGLTESWFNARLGHEYPMCPGTIAGEYDASQHTFMNQSFDRARTQLWSALTLMRRLNPRLRFILTVSPVPLPATASGKHVLVATMYSKSVLRAVAGQLADNNDHIDYFPSCEIINGTPFGASSSSPTSATCTRPGWTS